MTRAELREWAKAGGLTLAEAERELRAHAVRWRELARSSGDPDQAREAGRYLARADAIYPKPKPTRALRETCGCAHAVPARGAAVRARGRLVIDHAALRRELGGVKEIVETMASAKASGRPSANVSVMWRYFTTSVYKSGDLPWLATREAIQNGLDAIRAAVRHRQVKQGDGEFHVTVDRKERTIQWEDNGIGMDADTIIGKFLAIGESGKRDAADSGEAAGGFGVAKAVILGVSQSFRWQMHTRDNLAIAEGADKDVQVYSAPFRQGTRLTVYDIDPELLHYYDRARGGYIDIADRLRELLAANDLPNVRFRLSIDGRSALVEPLFSRRGGSQVSIGGSWGNGSTARVKAYRRMDKLGAYYVRLGGLYQFKVPSQRGSLKADVVVDLDTSVRPGARGYPFNSARDDLQDTARWTFSDVVDEVERENESTGRNADDEFFEAEGDDGDEEMAAQLAEAFAAPDVQSALADAVGGIGDYYAEQAKYAATDEPVASAAPAGTKPSPREDAPDRAGVLPAGMTVATKAAAVEGDIAGAMTAQAATEIIRGVLSSADAAVVATDPEADASWTGRRDRGLYGPSVELALDHVAAGDASEADLATIEQAVDRVAERAMGAGGGGLLVAVAGARALAALEKATKQRRVSRNPFGRFAGLRVSKRTYDRGRSYRFRKGVAKWTPYLLAWDGVLRLVASEARMRRAFRPGFVLDDNVVAEANRRPNGTSYVLIHPDRMAQVVKAHKERPIAIAGFLHAVACHELTHVDGKMGDGHDEEFVARREDLGFATAHLLPAIAILVQKLLRLPERKGADARRVVRLERQVGELRAAVAEGKRLVARLSRSAPAPAPAPAVRSSSILRTVVRQVAANPPAGWTRAEIVAFADRHEAHLARLVSAAFGGVP